MKRFVVVSTLVLSLIVVPRGLAEDPASFHTPILPPVAAWHGASESRIASAEDPWLTPTEKGGFTRTPTYDETIAWLQRLDKAAPEIRMVSIGRSPEGRDIWMVIASRDRAFTPEAMRRSGKPVILAQAGIHAGEIDGKDAGMMLLRDMTVSGNRKRLLDGASLLFIPMFNVDGHERVSEYGRVNQRGPTNPGWRTNSKNLNLNRDYTKADTPEMRAMLRVLQQWQPDLYFDIHVTDGADYQYDITYGFNGPLGWSPVISAWLHDVLTPAVDSKLAKEGHIPGRLVNAIYGNDLSRGVINWTTNPRFSHGYGDVVHIPSILVENHSLKPYRQRVLGTCVLLEAALETVAANRDSLRKAIAEQRASRPASIAIAFGVPADPKIEMIDFLGIESSRVPSAISGEVQTVYTGKAVSMQIPVVPYTPKVSATRPKAYWIPPAWEDVIERLALHGIRMERITKSQKVDAEMYRLVNARFEAKSWETNPFEGRPRLMADPKLESRMERYPAGSVRIPTDQPLGELVMLLLEPDSPDSFFQWGFFTEVLQHTEYIEEYVINPMAEKMLEDDPALAAEFNAKLDTDKAFRGDPDARLKWFYEKTPFEDERWLLYPVAREK